MSKSFKKIASIALPIIGTMVAPGIGTALGSSLSSGALAATGGALGGAAGGALKGGGLKSALTGAALGGAGGYLAGGGLGSVAGSTLDKVSGIAGAQGPTAGSGILGAATRSAPGLSSILSGGASGGGSLSLGNLATIGSAVNSYGTQDKLQKQLLESQGRAEAAIAPYNAAGAQASQQLSDRLSSGFDSSNLANDAGYQFQLAEGNKALERSLAAKGMGQSGAALKAAQEYGQGLASTSYNDAYQRWLNQNQQLAGSAGQGLSSAGALADVYTNQGNVRAGATVGKTNTVNSLLSTILSGDGTNKKRSYTDAYGNPVYL